MSARENKALIRRYLKALDEGNVEALDEFVSPDFVDHSPFPGFPPDREGLKRSFLLFKAATPGYHTVDDLIAEGDRVVARVTGYGTHEGEILGIPPTGRPIRMAGIAIWRIRGGKIVERWAINDMVDLLQQLGGLPPAGKPRG